MGTFNPELYDLTCAITKFNAAGRLCDFLPYFENDLFVNNQRSIRLSCDLNLPKQKIL